MVDVTGAAIQSDHPVVPLDLEIDPARAERARLHLYQGEHADAEPALAHLGHQVELVDAGLPAAGLDAERPAQDHIADSALRELHQPPAAEWLACGQRRQRRGLPILVEGVAILDAIRPHELLEQRQIRDGHCLQAHGLVKAVSCA